MRPVLSFLAGVLSMFAVQFLVTRFWGIVGISWGPGNLPATFAQQVAALSTTFLAMCAGAAPIARFAGRAAWPTIGVFIAVGVLIDGYFMFVKVEGLALWFRIAFVSVIPLASVLTGFVLISKKGETEDEAAA